MKFIDSYDPSTGNKIGVTEVTPLNKIHDKVERAHEAKYSWGFMSPEERTEVLRKIYDDLAGRKSKFAENIAFEVGIPIAQAGDEVGGALGCFKWYLENAANILKPKIAVTDIDGTKQVSEQHYTPRGVTAVFPPWNYPLSDFMGRVLPNLFAGNPVVIKASPECTLLMKKVEDIFKNHLPHPGIFDMVYGEAEEGQALLDKDIEFICFSGSSEVGKQVQAKAGEKGIHIISELGGSARAIIFPGASPKAVEECVTFNRLSYNGQICDGLTVIEIHESLANEMRDMLIRIFNEAVMRDAMDEKTVIGPLSSPKQVEHIHGQVQQAVDTGAKILVGGKKPENNPGFFYPATLIEIPQVTDIYKKFRVCMEDVFGPVLSIISFKTREEAIKIFNATRFGLGGYIQTGNDKNSIDEAVRLSQHLDTGMVAINKTCYVHPSLWFGGRKESGLGRIGGDALRDHCEQKVITRPYQSAVPDEIY